MYQLEMKDLDPDSSVVRESFSTRLNSKFFHAFGICSLGIPPSSLVTTQDGGVPAGELLPGMNVLTGTNGYSVLRTVLIVRFVGQANFPMVSLKNFSAADVNTAFCGSNQGVVLGARLRQGLEPFDAPRVLRAGVVARIYGLEFVQNNERCTVLLDLAGPHTFYANGVPFQSNEVKIRHAKICHSFSFERRGFPDSPNLHAIPRFYE